jgi:hypothetical protein
VYVDDDLAPTQPTDRAAISLAERMADVAVIANAVQAGELMIDEETGGRLLTTLRHQVDAAEDWLKRLRGMSRPVPLGTNWVGQAMSDKFERRADGEDVSFVAVLDQYHQTLVLAHGAVDEAIRRYQSTEEGHVTALRHIATTEL